MEVLLTDGHNWVKRTARQADDSLRLEISESSGSDGQLDELLSIVVLAQAGRRVVRADVLEFFPEAYIGGGLTYSETGEPKMADLIVELDFNQNSPLHSPSKKMVRHYGGETDGSISGNGERERIKFPQHWSEQGDKLVFGVEVRTLEGQWLRRDLTFPARITAEMLKNLSKKKLTTGVNPST